MCVVVSVAAAAAVASVEIDVFALCYVIANKNSSKLEMYRKRKSMKLLRKSTKQ